MDEIILKTTEQGIVSNAKELHAALPDKLRKYNYLVNAENYGAAKEDRVHLNKYVAALKAKRKEFEETDLKPWFDAKAEIMAMEKETDAVSKALSEGMAMVENVEKEAKMERIRETFNMQASQLGIPFEKFYDRKVYDAKKWTDKKILEDIQLKVDKVVKDKELMEIFMPDDLVEQEQVKELYNETLDIGLAKKKADELKALREKVMQEAALSEEPKKQDEITEDEVHHIPEEVPKVLKETPKRQRIVAEFIAERAFYDEMNRLVRMHNVQCRVLEREEI